MGGGGPGIQRARWLRGYRCRERSTPPRSGPWRLKMSGAAGSSGKKTTAPSKQIDLKSQCTIPTVVETVNVVVDLNMFCGDSGR